MGSESGLKGFGWREVQDRGGAIKGNKIDIAVQTRTEAFKIGRQKSSSSVHEGGEHYKHIKPIWMVSVAEG